MTVHIGAKSGEIAETVLMPGDPLRAKFIAETYLEKAICYNQIRGMLGFTGHYKGKRVSVQGSGMGIPSISIYASELIDEYKVKNIIRIGSCGAFQPNLNLLDVVIAMSASTDSNINNITFQGANFAATANFELLLKSYEIAKKNKFNVHVGNILSTDIFYSDDENYWKKWMSHGVLAVEMESAALYSIAAKKGVKALSLLTVSDHFLRAEKSTAEEREKKFSQMVEIALELA